MRRDTYTDESTANATKTHTLPVQSDTKWIDIKSLTISTRSGDIAADVEVSILDDTTSRWKVWLRSGQIFGGFFPNIGVIQLSSGVLKITTGAAGAGVIVSISCAYHCFRDIDV